MKLVDYLKMRDEKIEKMKESLFKLQHDLEYAEVEYQGKEAIIMEVDWREKTVLLKYDDVNMQWISFGD